MAMSKDGTNLSSVPLNLRLVITVSLHRRGRRSTRNKTRWPSGWHRDPTRAICIGERPQIAERASGLDQLPNHSLSWHTVSSVNYIRCSVPATLKSAQNATLYFNRETKLVLTMALWMF
jgi:hypothetical protein